MLVRVLIRNVTDPAPRDRGERRTCRIARTARRRYETGVSCIFDYFFVRIVEFISGFGRGNRSEGN